MTEFQREDGQDTRGGAASDGKVTYETCGERPNKAERGERGEQVGLASVLRQS